MYQVQSVVHGTRFAALQASIKENLVAMNMLPGRFKLSKQLLVALTVLGSVCMSAILYQLLGPVVSMLSNAFLLGGFMYLFLNESDRVQTTVHKKTLALQNLAYRDSLTGLPNRRFVTWLLEQNLAARAEGGVHVTNVNRVLLFDLNGFKAVNDTYGHEAGDALLKFIARTLFAHLPADTILARLGGDEFVVMVPDKRGGRKTREVEQCIRQAASSTLLFNGQAISVSASVGVSSPATARTTADDLLREADQRMYADKCASRPAQTTSDVETDEPVRPSGNIYSLKERRQFRRAGGSELVF